MAPGVISFNLAISTCEKGRRWERALPLLEMMQVGRNASGRYFWLGFEVGGLGLKVLGLGFEILKPGFENLGRDLCPGEPGWR